MSGEKRLLQKRDEAEVDSFLDRARQGIHCRLFCKGKSCPHEDYTKQKTPNAPPAIVGLNSSWVGGLIVASQRPSSSLFLKHMLVEQFRQKQITGIFNLQEKGEHATCGPDNIYSDSGYSYNGERDCMQFGISYYEFPWPDMTAPESDIVLRSVQCMDYHIRNKGKVLVHCHAGLGRTGLMIACYFIIAQRYTAQEAVELVRADRSGAVQTQSQTDFCYQFERYVRGLSRAYRLQPSDALIDFDSFIKRQFQYLHGEAARTYRLVPRHIHKMLCRIIVLVSEGDPRTSMLALESLSSANRQSSKVMQEMKEQINAGGDNFDKIFDVTLLTRLVMDWFRSLHTPFLPPSFVKDLSAALRQPPPAAKRGRSGDAAAADPAAVPSATGSPRLATAAPFNPAATFLASLPRPYRHTIGMMLSFVVVLAKEAPPNLHDFALNAYIDAFTQTSNMAHSSLMSGAGTDPVSRRMLQSAFYAWAVQTQDMYFSLDSVPKDRHYVAVVATASELCLGVGPAQLKQNSGAFGTEGGGDPAAVSARGTGTVPSLSATAVGTTSARRTNADEPL